MHDYQTNIEADQMIKAVHQLTAEIHAQVVPHQGPTVPSQASPTP
jgi:hypothetical protein